MTEPVSRSHHTADAPKFQGPKSLMEIPVGGGYQGKAHFPFYERLDTLLISTPDSKGPVVRLHRDAEGAAKVQIPDGKGGWREPANDLERTQAEMRSVAAYNQIKNRDIIDIGGLSRDLFLEAFGHEPTIPLIESLDAPTAAASYTPDSSTTSHPTEATSVGFPLLRRGTGAVKPACPPTE